MNGKQAKRLRALGLKHKGAKRAFNALTHTQKQPVLASVAQMQFIKQLEEQVGANLDKLEESDSQGE